MGLGLQRLANAAVGVATVAVTAVCAGSVATAGDPSASWKVTVASASRTLFPGTEAAMPYEVRNDTATPERLHGTAAELKNDGVGVYDTNTHRYADECPASWLHVVANNGPSEVDVAPGGAVNGVLTLRFEDAGVTRDACRNLGLEVVVNAS